MHADFSSHDARPRFPQPASPTFTSDTPVAVYVQLLQQSVELLIRDAVPHAGQQVVELGGHDEAAALLVDGVEGFLQLLGIVDPLQGLHQLPELAQVHLAPGCKTRGHCQCARVSQAAKQGVIVTVSE